MSNELLLSDVFMNKGVRAFGQALRFAVRDDKSPDFASLVELEYVETKEGFADAIKKFLRRYETLARRREQENQPTFRPNQSDLESLMQLVDEVKVKPVRAAIIAHALVYSTKKDGQPNETSNSEDLTNDR